MSNWNPQYVNRSLEPAQDPVYCLIIFEDRTRLGVINSDSLIEGDVYDSMTLRTLPDARTFMLYDATHWELDRGFYDSGTNQIAVTERGSFGSEKKFFAPSKTNVGAVWQSFTTEAISGTDGFLQTGMLFPDGSEQEMDLIEGHTRTNPVTVQVFDTAGRITKRLKGTTLIGKQAMILGGYRSLPFSKFTTLHCGPITRMNIRHGSVYDFEIDTILVKLKRKLFTDVAAFSTTLSGNMTSGQTTIPLTDNSGCYDSAPTLLGYQPGIGPDGTADNQFSSAMYFKVGNEYMRHEGGLSPQNITRGCLGSSAASHTSGNAVDMIFVVEGNPINVLLGFLLTRDPGLQPMLVNTGSGGYLDFWNTVDEAKGALGLGLDPGDVDVDGIKAIRDQWVTRIYGRFAFSKETDMESNLRESILKPLGLNFYVTRAGKLSLAVLRPTLDEVVYGLDESNVRGVPEIEFTNDEIVNEVTVEYDFDYVTGDAASKVTVIDATSQSTYDRAGDTSIGVTWLRDAYFGGGLSKAQQIATRKMRHHKEPNPTLSLSVLFTESQVDLGTIPQLTIPGLPDPTKGRIGWEEMSAVIGRRVDWASGMLTLDVIHTAYFGKRYCLISPNGTLDYSAADEETRRRYGFAVTDGTGLMSDGSQPYVIM